MTAAPFVYELLSKHDRSGFRSGNSELDIYFRQQVGQDVRKSACRCYLALDSDSKRIAGYFTLSAAEFRRERTPHEFSRKMPRYTVLPAVRIGRLAVSLDYQGMGIGAAMLFEAARLTADNTVGAITLIVDAIDDSAVTFYRHHGFLPYANDGRSLMIPVRSLLSLP